MKIKQIMLITLLLMAVLTIGAVSAAENITDDVAATDDTQISADEKTDIDLNVNSDKEMVNYREGRINYNELVYEELEESNLRLFIDGNQTDIRDEFGTVVFDTSNLAIGTHSYLLNFIGNDFYNPANGTGSFEICDIAVNAPEKYVIGGYTESELVTIVVPKTVTGEVEVIIADQSQTQSIEYDEDDLDNYTYLAFWYGKYQIPCGESDIVVKINDETVRTFKLITDYIMNPSQDVRYGKDEFYVALPIGMDEEMVSVSIDGEIQEMNYEIHGDGAYNGARLLTLDIAKQFSVGNHTITVNVTGDEFFTKKSFEGVLTVMPVISVERDIMNGDNITLYMPDDATGDVEIWLTYLESETLKPYKYTTAKAAGDVFIPLVNLTVGLYSFDYRYTGSDGYKIGCHDLFFTVNPDITYPKQFQIGTDASISIDYPGHNGTLIVEDDDYITIGSAKLVNGKANISLAHTVLPEGECTLRVTFEDVYAVDDDGYEYTNTYWYYPIINVTKPAITIPNERILLGDDAKVSADLPGFNGTLIVRKYVKEGEGYAADLVNGKADVKVIDLSEGKHSYYAHLMLNKLDIDGNATFDEYFWEFDVDVVNPISAKDATVIYTQTSKYSATIKDLNGKAVSSGKVTFYILDGKKQILKKEANIKNGVATMSFKITTAPKTYTIKTVYNKASISKKLTVKHAVTLKSATVKKSAKSLTIQATLSKVNGKYLKNKQVTFKFNGKTYKAKTNSKGVAKVTIKSNVLKKLKVGKKVTYQATYLKDTVKKTVKVKK